MYIQRELGGTIEKALRYMRKAGYLRYVPLEDHWLFSGKAAGTLKRIADTINDFQKPAQDPADCDDMAEQLAFGIGMKEKSQDC